jgi:hypothetical protein
MREAAMSSLPTMSETLRASIHPWPLMANSESASPSRGTGLSGLSQTTIDGRRPHSGQAPGWNGCTAQSARPLSPLPQPQDGPRGRRVGQVRGGRVKSLASSSAAGALRLFSGAGRFDGRGSMLACGPRRQTGTRDVEGICGRQSTLPASASANSSCRDMLASPIGTVSVTATGHASSTGLSSGVAFGKAAAVRARDPRDST